MTEGSSSQNSEIIFFEKTPFVSVELLDLLKNYKIICYHDDPVYRYLRKSWDIDTYSDAELSKELESDKAVEIMLEDNKFLSRTIRDKENSSAVFFFMNRRIDELLRAFGMRMALAPYGIQEDLGDKLSLPEICKDLGLPCNSSLVFKNLEEDFEMAFEKCRKEFGTPFILQGSQGVSGEDTFLVDSEGDFLEKIKTVNGVFKATKYLRNNIPVSVHLCVLKEATLIRGPFLQIVGFSGLSSKPFEFSGNDTNQSLFNDSFVESIRSMSSKIAEYAKSRGYRGIFGIDFLWDKEVDKIYIQELNVRFVGLTRLLTGIQKDQGLYPDILKHIEEFESLRLNVSDFSEGEISLSEHDYSQVIVYNNFHSIVTVVKYLEPGMYRLENGIFLRTKPSLFVKDLEQDEILITYAAHVGRKLYPGGMIARMILKKTVIVDGRYEIEPQVMKMISNLRDHVLTTI